ncbi:MAG: hypothetical protein M0Z53_10690 [Thermaerobacter sp.]|nr:hypothetical protein [Thermaerobacter sp.]
MLGTNVITLLGLPSDSPNLYLIARLGKLLKTECLPGRYYSPFTPFQEAMVKTLEHTSPAYKEKRAS